ncbi:MAG TPA: pyrimidine/purine nucleoside phosphorylase [Bacteroidales bacterium]|nr:pyrimidine/purine nucleoside phosphorylase [Bacteroidales bacterium]
MIKVNEYFGGNVKSLAFSTADCPATIGVMAAGEYEFGTSTVEYMTVTSGVLHVMLPGETEWKAYEPFSTFIVDKGVKFRVKALADVSYLCLYK